MKRTLLNISLAFLLVTLLLAYQLIISPQLERARRQRMIQQYQVWIDRAKGEPRDNEALRLLIEQLRSRDSWDSTEAAIAIGQVGPNAEPAVDALVDALSGGDPFVAREAARSLGNVGPAAKRAAPALIAAAIEGLRVLRARGLSETLAPQRLPTSQRTSR